MELTISIWEHAPLVEVRDLARTDPQKMSWDAIKTWKSLYENLSESDSAINVSASLSVFLLLGSFPRNTSSFPKKPCSWLT